MWLKEEKPVTENVPLNNFVPTFVDPLMEFMPRGYSLETMVCEWLQKWIDFMTISSDFKNHNEINLNWFYIKCYLF